MKNQAKTSNDKIKINNIYNSEGKDFKSILEKCIKKLINNGNTHEKNILLEKQIVIKK